jgi:hypothetical protein
MYRVLGGTRAALGSAPATTTQTVVAHADTCNAE